MPEPGSPEQGLALLQSTYPAIDSLYTWGRDHRSYGFGVPTEYSDWMIPSEEQLRSLETKPPAEQVSFLANRLAAFPHT